MNNIDKSYQALLQDILDNGVVKSDRTGTGTISVFGRQIRHKMSEGFPLLTTKKVHWNSIVAELLWFLRGDTNIKFLLDYDCHIWTGDAYKRYVEAHKKEWSDKMTPGRLEKSYPDIKEFENLIKTVPEFDKQWGDLGPIYGKQWRQWQGWVDMDGNEKGSLWYDQILEVVHSLKTNPDSRRLMVSAWNVAELDQMTLPPCHYGFQLYTRELSIKERLDLGYKTYKELFEPFDFHRVDHEEIDELYPVPRRAISLMWNQRSVDTFLGLPFNIASYGLLLEIIAKEVDMVPEDLIGNLGDVHLYSNHIEQAKEQIGKKYTSDERSEMLKEAMGYEIYNQAVEELSPFGGGLSEYYEMHKIPTHSREPYELPTIEITERNWYQHQLVKERLGPKTFKDIILSYRPDCFELIGYESHPKIKAPLSN
jgi:thymidylate synthase